MATGLAEAGAFSPTSLQESIKIFPLEAETAPVAELGGRHDALPRPSPHRFDVDTEIGHSFGDSKIMILVNVTNVDERVPAPDIGPECTQATDCLRKPLNGIIVSQDRPPRLGAAQETDRDPRA
jgi:hypothetical protein